MGLKGVLTENLIWKPIVVLNRKNATYRPGEVALLPALTPSALKTLSLSLSHTDLPSSGWILTTRGLGWSRVRAVAPNRTRRLSAQNWPRPSTRRGALRRRRCQGWIWWVP